MLKLEKNKKKQPISVVLRKTENRISKELLIAFSIAFAFHFSALFLFHIKKSFETNTLLHPIQLTVENPLPSSSLQIEEEYSISTLHKKNAAYPLLYLSEPTLILAPLPEQPHVRFAKKENKSSPFEEVEEDWNHLWPRTIY